MKKVIKNKTNKKTYLIMFFGIIVGVIISIASSYAIAETLIKSVDVSYVDNSNLKATNVQAAIDGTCTKFSNDLQSFLLKVYPVGSIYISYNNTNPGTLFGGTWENYGNGRVLKGINSGTAGTTGGSSTVTLSMSNIPAHTHDISHTHTTKVASITDVSVSTTTNLVGQIIMHRTNEFTNIQTVNGVFSTSKALSKWGNLSSDVSTATSVGDINFNGNHTHTVTGTIPSLTTNSISTTTSGSAGSSNPTAINVQDPYITVYMWRRTK